jgi:hypothetical protein
MFPKPPRPEPPRRAIATQVVQQRDARQVPDTLVVERPAPPVPGTPVQPADSPAPVPPAAGK